ncbi:MAG: 4a-hydroxytetrahydrobiopterin dehydratase [Phycisphaerae bacterium]|nr:4a-hydroxytetrahydrobiopterin dehydratase [Phycisphaerae bacterium]
MSKTPRALTQDQVDVRLASRSEWSQTGDAIQRTFAFADFLHSIAFVEKIAAEAERTQHHPDILIRYNKVTLTLSTHDAKGITAKDFDAAAFADAGYGGA